MVEISITINLMFSEFSLLFQGNVTRRQWEAPIQKTLKNSLTYWKTKGENGKTRQFVRFPESQSKF